MRKVIPDQSTAAYAKRRRASIKRRDFLKQAASYALFAGGAGALATSTRLEILGSALAATSTYNNLGDHKALVCVFLSGGCDTFQLFAPGDPQALERQQSIRGEMGLKSEAIDFYGAGADQIGFNKSLRGLGKLYSEGDLAVIQNIGNLHAPVTRADFLANRSWLPPHLFSHSHQYSNWSTASSPRMTKHFDSGWAGRIADLVIDADNRKESSQVVSLSGQSPWLTGAKIQPAYIGSEELRSIDLLGLTDVSGADAAHRQTRDAILALPTDHKLKQRVSKTLLRAQNERQVFAELLEEESDFVGVAEQPKSQLAASLQQVARLIALQKDLQLPRQLFFVQHPGWDTHTNQQERMATLMAELDDALFGFQRSLFQSGLADSVTTFTASEFARTLTPTSSGSGHGWAGHALVMGGAVSGARVLGTAPSYQLGAADDAGNLGRFIPSTSTSQLGADIAKWFGLGEADIRDIFPDLGYLESLIPINLFNA